MIPTPAGVVQGRLLFVVVVQAGCDVVLLFLFEHFNTVQCPTLSREGSFDGEEMQLLRSCHNGGHTCRSVKEIRFKQQTLQDR